MIKGGHEPFQKQFKLFIFGRVEYLNEFKQMNLCDTGSTQFDMNNVMGMHIKIKMSKECYEISEMKSCALWYDLKSLSLKILLSNA